MRKAILAAMLAVMLVTWPAHAQSERVLLDMTVRVLRAQETGICMQVDPGTITSTVEAVGPGIVPVRFVLGPYGNSSEADGRVNTMVATAPATYVTHLGQQSPGYTGFACYTLRNETPLPPDGRIYADEVLRLSQLVAIKLVWSPA